MAGSWRHMTTENGRLRNNETFCGMIENLGDAYEAAEECFGMAWYLAWLIAMIRAIAGQDPQELARTGAAQPTRAQIMAVIREAEEHYRDGLRIGGVQRGND